MATKRINADVVKTRLISKGIVYVGGYTDTHEPFQCRCEVCNHIWNAYWGNVSSKGCPRCARQRGFDALKLSVAAVAQRLRAKGVELLSPYRTTNERGTLRCCACGNQWTTLLSVVLGKSGCPRCSLQKAGIKRRLSVDYVACFLGAKSIKLLDPYVGGFHTNVYKVECVKCGYHWKATFATLRYHACPACAGVLPKTADDYAKLASIYKGKCLNIGRNTCLKSRWECADGHQFNRAYQTIVRDKTFCTSCQNNRSEEICRRAFETLFKRPFPKIRIKMEGYHRALELDGYCPDLKLAFEHQGSHHYEVAAWRKHSKTTFCSVTRNDRIKKLWTAKNDITLVVIPELFSRTPLATLEAFIRAATLGIPCAAASLDANALEQMPMPVSSESERLFSRIKVAAAAKGLAVVSDRYAGTRTNYEFKCPVGHLFAKPYKSVLKSIRCPVCKEVKHNEKTFKWAEIGLAHQYIIRQSRRQEDIARLASMGMTAPTKASEFTLAFERLTSEHADFVTRYEWLGNAGFGVKWCYAARFNGLLGGVVLLSEPYRFEKLENREAECLIQRGACAAWTPKNLGSMLVSFACRHMAVNTAKRLFFAYADPAAGEIGTIYQACNFTYLGPFKKTVYTHRGIVKSAQTAKRTRRLMPWVARQGISLTPDCFTARGYLRWSAIPISIRRKLRAHVKQTVNKWNRQELLHGKYVQILGSSKSEQKKLSELYAFKAYPYPKRLSSIKA